MMATQLVRLLLCTTILATFCGSIGGQTNIVDTVFGEKTRGCGTTKGCFFLPTSCDSPTTCSAFASWFYMADTQELNISLWTTAAGYVAIGFSKSGFMDNSDVYACTSNREVTRSKNVGHDNIPKEKKGIEDESEVHSQVDGYIDCSFQRKVVLDDGDETFFNLSSGNRYSVLLAIGDTLKDSGALSRHTARQISAETIDLTEASQSTAVDGSLILAQLHGVLMTVAWMGFASVGITSARFLKPVWSEVEFFGSKVWFLIHRGSMVLCFVFYMIAYVLIMIYSEGYLDFGGGPLLVRTLHATFGSIVVLLGLVNVAMGVFRPHPGEPRRNLYNWAHWSVGTSAHLFALITILLGVANHPDQVSTPLLSTIKPFVFWVVVVGVIYHAAMWLILTLIGLKKEPEKGGDIPMEAGGQANVSGDALATTTTQRKENSPVKAPVFYFYVVITFCLVIVVSIGMFV